MRKFAWCTGLELCRGIGLIVRGRNGVASGDQSLVIVSTADDVAMASMSAARCGWMEAVLRAIHRRHHSAGARATHLLV